MVASRQDERMTVDEWRALERTSEVRHEYIDGYVYAMAGGSGVQWRIAMNVGGLLDAALGDGPCIAYNSDRATRVSKSCYSYADLACAFQ
jgi:Uma2 family endonuclease